MTTYVELKKAVEDNLAAHDEYKKTNDARLDALKKGQDGLAGELDQKLGKINATLEENIRKQKEIVSDFEIDRARIEELESRKASPGKTQREVLEDEYKSNFIDWVRNKGNHSGIEQKLNDLMKKDVTVASSAGGGYAVPTVISQQITLLQQKYSPVRNLVKVVQVGTSDYKELVDIGGASYGWVGETDSRTATNTAQLREVAPTHGELYAYPQASEWSLDDIFFNVEQWLSDSVGRGFAKAEGIAVLTGNGTNKPTGMLNTAPVATADDASPKRNAAAYQYVLSGDNSPAAIDGDALIDLQYTLNSAYRANAVWAMNSNTTGAVRKLKASGSGEYIWQPSLAAGQPDLLLGKAISYWEDMDDIGGGKLPVAFGDFGQGYLLTDRIGLRITRDNVTNVGYVRFYVRRREGGKPLNNDAVKFMKCL